MNITGTVLTNLRASNGSIEFGDKPHSNVYSGTTHQYPTIDYTKHILSDQSLLFTSGNSVIDYTDTVSMGTKDYTLAFWINLSSDFSGYFIIYNAKERGSFSIVVRADVSLNLGLSMVGDALAGSKGFSVNTWNYLVCQRSSGVTKLFLNGKKIGETSAVYNYADSTFHIGIDGDAVSYRYGGSVNIDDCVFILDQAVWDGDSFDVPTTYLLGANIISSKKHLYLKQY